MISAFGVEHGDEVSKADRRSKDRAEHYGRMAGTNAALAGAAGTVGGGSAIVGASERKGLDPMGFTFHQHNGKVGPKASAKILRGASRDHFYQAKMLGGAAVAAGALAGAYKIKQKRELSKADTPGQRRERKSTDLGLAAGSAAVGGVTMKEGMRQAKFLNRQANEARDWGMGHHHTVAGAKRKMWDLEPEEMEHAKKARLSNAKVFAVKKPAAALAVGAAAAGGASLYELARHGTRKRSVSKGMLGLKRGPHRLTGIMSDLAGTTTVTTRRSGTWALKPSERIVTTNKVTGKGTEYRSGGGTTKKAKAAVFGASAVAASPAGYYGAKKVNIS